jgi:uncharacterized membrane protein
MTVLALAVAAYAIALVALPAMRPPFIRDRLLVVPAAVFAHFIGGAIALALGPFQFLDSIRARHLAIHRWIGRLYLSAIVLGGGTGLVLAARSQGGLVAHVGFGLLAVAWLASSGAAYVAIRRGRIPEHRRWMTRSFALTLAAVALRIYLPLSLIAGIPFATAYPAIAWLCWVPNLLVAERWFVERRPRADGVPAVV